MLPQQAATSALVSENMEWLQFATEFSLTEDSDHFVPPF